jgi:hypothetical protein
MGGATLAAPLAESGAGLAVVKSVEALGSATGAFVGTLPAAAANSSITGSEMPDSGQLLVQGTASAAGAVVGVGTGVAASTAKPVTEKLGSGFAAAAETALSEGAGAATEQKVGAAMQKSAKNHATDGAGTPSKACAAKDSSNKSGC